MVPVWYSSQCARMKGVNTTKFPIHSSQPGPMPRLAASMATTNCTTSASQPWSNSWPSGLLDPVRRACLPSRQSMCR